MLEGYNFEVEERKVTSSTKEGFQTIALEHLSYSYGNKALHFPDFHIQKGRKYVVTGESGSGKTTLINVLNGNFRNYKGRLSLDGQDYKAIDYDTLKQTIGTMTQTIDILNGSVLYNIILDQAYDQSKFQKVIQKAKLDSLLAELPDGVDTLLNSDGLSLSGGQLQRISLARTLYKETPILILDEGTANLDHDTALDIEETLFRDPNLTVIMITHHLNSTIADLADEHIQIA